jgi:hypothetical protein
VAEVYVNAEQALMALLALEGDALRAPRMKRQNRGSMVVYSRGQKWSFGL